MADAQRDSNFVPTLIGVSNADGVTPVRVYADPTTHRLLVDTGGGGSGDVVGPASATDNAIVRYNSTTGKSIQNSVVTISDTGVITVNSAYTLPNADGTAGYVLTTDGLGAVTFQPVTATPAGSNTQVQFNNAGALGGITGATSDGTTLTLVAPVLGTPASGTLTNCVGLPISTGVAGLGTGVATALAVNTGLAGAVVLFDGAGGTPSSITLTNGTGLPIAGITGLGTDVATALAIAVGSAGAFVVNGGALGTPSSGTLTNATGLPISTGVSGLGTSVATALAVAVGSAGAVVVNGGALGTPSSGTLTNATGLPISTGVSGLGTGVATFLATPSSANLVSAVTDETGSGALVFGTSPTIASPTITGTADVTRIDYDKGVGTVVAGGNLGATETIDFNNGTHFTGTLDSNITFTYSNATSGQVVTLYLSYDGTAQRTITWPTTTWLDNASGAAPTTPAASGNVLVVTVSYIGTTYYASATGNYAVYA